MSTTVTSADGTAIVCDVVGEGPSVVLVAGIFCTRHTLAPLAAVLAESGLTAATYDRRGRGDSGGKGPAPSPERAVATEIEDLAAVMGGLGDDVAVYGHSSGACVAFHAAAAGMPVRRLVLHEPPWSDDDADDARAQNELILTAVAEGRLDDAITVFMADTGMPADALQAMATDPAMVAVAPTMPYDVAVTGSDGAVPTTGLAAISVPTLVVAGTASPPFFIDTARRVATLVPGARLAMLEGADHGASAEVVGPAVSDFLAG